MSYWVHSNPDQPNPDDDGQRLCALEGRCTERDHSGQPKPGPRAFCGSDQNLIGRSLAWLPEAYVRLHQMIGETGTGQGEKVTSSRTPKLPINLEVDTLITDMVGLLDEWANRVREVDGLYQVPAEQAEMRRDAFILKAAVATLTPRLNALLALPLAPMARYMTLDEAASLGWVAPLRDEDRHHKPELGGADAGLEILHLHRRARNLLGMNPRHQDLPVPCWNEDCGLRTVRRWDGAAGLDDEASCTSCGERYTHDRYRLLIQQVAQQELAKGTRRRASA